MIRSFDLLIRAVSEDDLKRKIESAMNGEQDSLIEEPPFRLQFCCKNRELIISSTDPDERKIIPVKMPYETVSRMLAGDVSDMTGVEYLEEKRLRSLILYDEFGPGMGYPSMRQFFCESPYEWQEYVARYLRNGEVTHVACSRDKDKFTGELIPGERCGMTDGEYSWISSLAYYVERYNLQLDKAFVDKAESLYGWPDASLKADSEYKRRIEEKLGFRIEEYPDIFEERWKNGYYDYEGPNDFDVLTLEEIDFVYRYVNYHGISCEWKSGKTSK